MRKKQWAKEHQNSVRATTDERVNQIFHSEIKKNCFCYRDKADVITTKDVQDAVYASYVAYKEHKLGVGKYVPNSNYKITLLKEEKIFDDGAGFLVFLAEKGTTTMVTFRGTDT